MVVMVFVDEAVELRNYRGAPRVIAPAGWILSPALVRDESPKLRRAPNVCIWDRPSRRKDPVHLR